MYSSNSGKTFFSSCICLTNITFVYKFQIINKHQTYLIIYEKNDLSYLFCRSCHTILQSNS